MLDLFILGEYKSVSLSEGNVLLADIPNSPVRIVEASGFNDSAVDVYWQIHALDGGYMPVAGTIALYSIRVPAKQSFYWKPYGGFYLNNAGCWVASTAPATRVVGAGNCIWCLIKYVPEGVLGA